MHQVKKRLEVEVIKEYEKLQARIESAQNEENKLADKIINKLKKTIKNQFVVGAFMKNTEDVYEFCPLSKSWRIRGYAYDMPNGFNCIIYATSYNKLKLFFKAFCFFFHSF